MNPKITIQRKRFATQVGRTLLIFKVQVNVPLRLRFIAKVTGKILDTSLTDAMYIEVTPASKQFIKKKTGKFLERLMYSDNVIEG